MNNKKQTIKLPRTLANELLHQAQLGDKNEICGLVAAKNGHAQHCYPIPNTAEQPQTRYIMDPASQINALRHIRENNEVLFAIYHSHPSSPAEPSVTDIAEASYPEALYLIISLNTKGVLEIRGFRLQDGQSIEVELIIE